MAAFTRACSTASSLISSKQCVTSLSTSVARSLTCQQRAFSNVGFIGLGQMGSRMVKNIVTKGQAVSVYDVNADAVKAMVALGAKGCGSVGEVAGNADVVVTMLPNNAIVLDTYQRKGGILENVKAGTLLMDSSTVDPSVAITLAEAAPKSGARFIDGPVSGAVMGAQAGTLTFMVGGPAKDLDEIRPLLMLMGKKLFHCGAHGNGQVAKICNNMLLGITMMGTAEAMNLGMNLGLDKKLLLEIINVSSGRSWSSEICSPVPGTQDNVPSSDGQYKGGFGTRLIAKDLGLAQDAATRSLSPILLGSVAHQIYKTMSLHGLGDKDFSSVFKFLREKSD